MVELDNESSLLTTFNTPWGNTCGSDFPLLLKSAQERLNAVLKGITGYIDEILTRRVDSKDHGVNLLQLLETARVNGIKFNPEKAAQFKTTKCELLGQTITPEGMKVKERSRPSNR